MACRLHLATTMKSSTSLVVQLRANWPVIGSILVVSAALVGAVLLLYFWKRIPIGYLTRDVTAIGKLPFYTGFLSQISILLWAAAAAVCIFSVKALSTCLGNDRIKAFLFASALLTLVLGLDDAFQLHEEVFPHFVGVTEKLIVATYALLMLVYLIEFRSTILKTDYILFGMALGFLGLSAAIDMVDLRSINPFLFQTSAQTLYEDSAKLVGIMSWLAYFFRVGVTAVCINIPWQDTVPDG